MVHLFPANDGGMVYYTGFYRISYTSAKLDLYMPSTKSPMDRYDSVLAGSHLSFSVALYGLS
jgi:hypothetical protein